MKRLRVINKQLSVFFACLFVVMIGVYALISPGDGGDGHRMIDGFSVPFVAAALLGMITLVAAVRWLPELMAVPAPHAAGDTVNRDWRALARSLGPLLGMAFVAPLGLALFEATFALYGQAKFGYGPARVAALFVVCGLVMTVFQIGAVGLLAGRIRETVQIGAGFGLLGTGLALRAIVRSTFLVLALVGLLALGTALISPNLAALISQRSAKHGVGAALGIQNAAVGLGQATGPLLGAALFPARIDAPYLMTAALVFTVAVAIAWTALPSQRHARVAR